MNIPFRLILSLTITVLVSGCDRVPASQATAQVASSSSATKPVATKATVYKSASCGCCGLWVEHMREAGFEMETHDLDNMQSIKEEVGIPPGKGSCHTARIGPYFIEGHVPAADVKRLLAERPDAKGLIVPAMPIGSPGMEVPSGEVQPYDVLLVAKDGTTTVFAHYGD